MPPSHLSPVSPWSFKNRWVKLGFGLGLVLILLLVGYLVATKRAERESFIARDSYTSYGKSFGMPYEDSESQMAVSSAASPDSARMAEPLLAAPLQKPEQRLIKTGRLSMRVSDTPAAINLIRERVIPIGGFVESSSVEDSGQEPRSGQMVVRVPVQSFESTLTTIKQIAVVVLFESTDGQDVTEEFVDLQADLRNARAEETSYLDILKKSGTINDTLAVTQRLAEVRKRIERFEGRLRLMENRTELATIHISLTEDTRIEIPGRTWKPGEVMRQAVRDLIENIQGLVNVLIVIVITVLPVLAAVGILAWVVWIIGKAIVKKMRS